jgi:acyl dehydratase
MFRRRIRRPEQQRYCSIRNVGTAAEDKKIKKIRADDCLRISSTIPNMGRGVSVGQTATMKRLYTIEDVQRFGSVIQDFNPLHSSLDWDDALHKNPSLEINRKSGLIRFNDDDKEDRSNTTRPLVHGMLVASMFSSIFSFIAPGCIYMNQSIDFSGPVFVKELVLGRIEIERIRKWRKGGVVVQCNTQVLKLTGHDDHHEKEDHHEESSIVIKGTANVWLPDGSAYSLERNEYSSRSV